MCDENFEHDLDNYSRIPPLTRRQLGAVSLGAGMTFLLPRAADAQTVREQDVTIKTPDGECDAYFVHPASGASAAVIVWPDILGLRPAFRQMGKRLAESGYAVLTVNPFYRMKKSPVVPAGASFADQATRDIVMPLAKSLSPTTQITDARAFVAWLDGQTAVDKRRKIGTTGYCMGGPIVMRTAAAVPDRIGAGASFHGGGLVTKDPDSPHLLVPTMKAQFLFAVAENDDQRDPTAKDVL
jgi:carboxymethylenebutenolidase